MNLDLLRQIRNFLYRLTAISFGLTLIMAFATFALWDVWTGLSVKLFHASPEGLGPLLFNFFAFVKFYYIFVLLAPALALHWTIKANESKA